MSTPRLFAGARSRLLSPFALTLAVALGTAVPASAQAPSGRSLDFVGQVMTPTVDRQAAFLEDLERDRQGLPPRFAIPFQYDLSLGNAGTWENLNPDTLLWRLRVVSPAALSLNFGFTRYWLPEDASLVLHHSGQTTHFQAFTAANNSRDGELWSALVLGGDATIELTVPLASVDEVELQLTTIGVGYRGFGEKSAGGGRSGWCNNDTICPEGDPWRDEIASSGVYTVSGTWYCSGVMMNNTAQDETPYFLTADHCGVSTSNDQSVVVYWNFESPVCGALGGGSLADFTSGTIFRADYSPSDFTLLEMSSMPNPNWDVSYSGWDRTSADAVTAVAIHHPNCDEKAISFENDPTHTSSYLGTSPPGDGTHVWVDDWDDGTTEPGSSGSPLYDQNHHVVGQLHGGYAACGNDDSDWYGRLSVSWTGGGSNSTRLSSWLDPIGTGATTLDTLVPGATGLRVTPSTPLSAEGQAGGPFTPDHLDYTLENRGTTGFNYLVSNTQNWVDVSNASGFLAPAATTIVTVSLNSAANSFPNGFYVDTVTFENLNTHEGDTVRPVNLQVGVPSVVHSFPLNTNPGWTTDASWAFGQPTGGGGSAHGYPDPSSGHTGSNVYGYNLNGDYTNSMPEYHLTTGAIDCTGVFSTTVRFWRWLNVESPSYDHAYFRVRTSGGSWTTVWENGSEIIENGWSQVEYDISAIADGNSAVYLRWTMGVTDSSWLYSGWNIDDVEILGITNDEPGVAYCFGDPGIGTPCPCNNDNDGSVPGSGCSNGFNLAGAKLVGSGTASVGADTLVLATSGLEPNNTGLYFQADNLINGGSGNAFGDGLRCAGGNLIRLQIRTANSMGDSSTSIALGAKGGVTAGDTKRYQCWYRTIVNPPCGIGVNDFNLSNGYEITWLP